MATVNNDLYLHGAKGMLGEQMTARQTARGIEVGALPPQRTEHLCDRDKIWRATFRVGIAFGKVWGIGPTQTETARSCEVTTADLIHPAEVIKVDLQDYHGKAGDHIRVHTAADCQLTELTIVITTDQNVVVEAGRMQPDKDGNFWEYEVQAESPAHHVKIFLDASDLPFVVENPTDDVAA